MLNKANFETNLKRIWSTFAATLKQIRKTNTVQKVSVFGVLLVRIFPVFSHIGPEYGEIRSIQLECRKLREKCGPEKLQIRTLFT